jgi:hypothetical protein
MSRPAAARESLGQERLIAEWKAGPLSDADLARSAAHHQIATGDVARRGYPWGTTQSRTTRTSFSTIAASRCMSVWSDVTMVTGPDAASLA